MLAASDSSQTKGTRFFRFVDLSEALGFALFVFAYIWRLQASAFNSWKVFPVWLVLSFLLHRDTPKTLGWRGDNLWSAIRRAALVFVILGATISVAGLLLGAPHRLPSHLIDPRRFLGYLSFCLLQQIGLQSFLMNRLLATFGKSVYAVPLAATIFALLHWPNPVLVPLTFLGGVAFCWLFARERNIIPVVVVQAILGSLVWWAFPLAWHHAMRVGPGYYHFEMPSR